MSDTDTVYKVTMRLRQADVDKTNMLADYLGARSKADAISQALAIAAMVVDRMSRGEEVLFRKPGSDKVEQIVLPNVRRLTA